MQFKKRASGILLHPTSLPGPDGIGDLGVSAYQFVDFLALSKQKIWQILPLNLPGYGQSPYQTLSAFAGNHLLISLQQLVEEKLLLQEELADRPLLSAEKVLFFQVQEWKEKKLSQAAKRFFQREERIDYLQFCQKNNYWLSDYALFMALKEQLNGLPWQKWPKSLACRNKLTLLLYQKRLKKQIAYHCFCQFIFYQQWKKIKIYANKKGISIVGDLPIFVAADSSDTWVLPHLFQLDENGQPTKVAGVPPDYFSSTGQRWGNPLYRWGRMGLDDYHWWRERISYLLQFVDSIRLDHFRGFEAYWEIPAEEVTAVNGHWVKGPGEHFFRTLKKYLGELPFIAEDLGIITPEVEQLKENISFPGMKVLQFCLDNRKDRKTLLRSMSQETVLYTGTHDNDTLIGWYKNGAKPEAVRFLKAYLGISTKTSREDLVYSLLELVLDSKAGWVIIPLQDILCLGSESRMNTPGTKEGNWQWRFLTEQLTLEKADKLKKIVEEKQRG